MSGKLKVVCVDLWNTLIRSKIGGGASYEEFLTNAGVPRADIYPFVRDELMISRLTYSEMADRLQHHFGVQLDVPETQALIRAWRRDNCRVAWINGAAGFVKNLQSRGYTVVLLTNSTWPAWQEVDRILGLTARFDRIFVSCLEATAKPNPQTWSIIESWFPEAEFTMVGDNEADDLTGPRARGWRTVLTSATFKDVLEKVVGEPVLTRKAFVAARILRTDGLVIILDEAIDPEQRKALQGLRSSDGREVILLSDLDLARDLESMLAREDWQNTLVVFPGAGSQYPWKLSEICQRLKGVQVSAWRSWEPGNEPIVSTGLILPERFLLPEVETVLVVDDVISSGGTLQALHRANSWRFPRARWIAATWVTQRLGSVSQSGLEGYQQVFAACLVQAGRRSKVPINSLSSIRHNEEVAASYAHRNFPDPAAFLDVVASSM